MKSWAEQLLAQQLPASAAAASYDSCPGTGSRSAAARCLPSPAAVAAPVVVAAAAAVAGVGDVVDDDGADDGSPSSWKIYCSG